MHDGAEAIEAEKLNGSNADRPPLRSTPGNLARISQIRHC